jgi:hypothetical protein
MSFHQIGIFYTKITLQSLLAKLVNGTASVELPLQGRE